MPSLPLIGEAPHHRGVLVQESERRQRTVAQGGEAAVQGRRSEEAARTAAAAARKDKKRGGKKAREAGGGGRCAHRCTRRCRTGTAPCVWRFCSQSFAEGIRPSIILPASPGHQGRDGPAAWPCRTSACSSCLSKADACGCCSPVLSATFHDGNSSAHQMCRTGVTQRTSASEK